jgi:hypothetical protein
MKKGDGNTRRFARGYPSSQRYRQEDNKTKIRPGHTYILLNRPLIHNSLAFSSESQRLSSNNRVSQTSSAWSYALKSPTLMAAMKGENSCLRRGKRSSNSEEGRWPLSIRRGMRYARIRLEIGNQIRDKVAGCRKRTLDSCELRYGSYKKPKSVLPQTAEIQFDKVSVTNEQCAWTHFRKLFIQETQHANIIPVSHLEDRIGCMIFGKVRTHLVRLWIGR